MNRFPRKQQFDRRWAYVPLSTLDIVLTQDIVLRLCGNVVVNQDTVFNIFCPCITVLIGVWICFFISTCDQCRSCTSGVICWADLRDCIGYCRLRCMGFQNAGSYCRVTLSGLDQSHCDFDRVEKASRISIAARMDANPVLLPPENQTDSVGASKKLQRASVVARQHQLKRRRRQARQTSLRCDHYHQHRPDDVTEKNDSKKIDGRDGREQQLTLGWPKDPFVFVLV